MFNGIHSYTWAVWIYLIENIRALQTTCFSGWMTECWSQSFPSLCPLVCILHHLCRAATWLADVLLSLILRLPPTEKQNFATASHSQSKVEPGRVIFGMTAQDWCAIWERFPSGFSLLLWFHPTVVWIFYVTSLTSVARLLHNSKTK